MKAHAALQTWTTQQTINESPFSSIMDTKVTASANKDAYTTSDLSQSSMPIESLATQLHDLWQREKDQEQSQVNNCQEDDSYTLPALKTALSRIGSSEKNDLLLYFLEQEGTLRIKCSEAAALGEKIAAQLLHQQHKLRERSRKEISKLEIQLRDVLDKNSQVAFLQAKVEELERSNRDHEQQLRFAVQKLQRSRKKEKELKLMSDSLWD